MKIQLVSFSLKHKFSRVRNIADIINNSQSDLILFSGWAIVNDKDVEELLVTLHLQHTSILIVRNVGSA